MFLPLKIKSLMGSMDSRPHARVPALVLIRFYNPNFLLNMCTSLFAIFKIITRKTKNVSLNMTSIMRNLVTLKDLYILNAKHKNRSKIRLVPRIILIRGRNIYYFELYQGHMVPWFYSSGAYAPRLVMPLGFFHSFNFKFNYYFSLYKKYKRRLFFFIMKDQMPRIIQ